jgi:CheY-like chemotaxis protein
MTSRAQVETERLASVGTLAAGVAHEINNPLTYVACNVAHALSLLDRLEGADRAAVVEELRACLTDAVEGTGRVAEIVGDLRVLARPHRASGEMRAQTAPLEAVDVRAAAVTSLRMVNLVTRHRARVELAVDDDVPRAGAIEARLCQVLVNLVANAAHAFVDDDPVRNVIRVEASTRGEHIELVVRDNGPGIEPARLSAILEPFVTGGAGMGLGLSISKAIVGSFGGTLRVTSEVGVGTAVRVVLKRASSAMMPTAMRPSGEYEIPSARRRPRVLVVDDEPKLCTLAQRILGGAFEITVAHDAAQAMRAIQAGSACFDAVLCDVRMPGGSGLDLWSAVAAQWPDLARRFVFVTGGIESRELERKLASTGRKCLTKPFRPQVVIDLLSRTAKS